MISICTTIRTMFTGLRCHTSELPVDDKRITIVNPIGASENNNNLVPTANCFMIVPGRRLLFRSL